MALQAWDRLVAYKCSVLRVGQSSSQLLTTAGLAASEEGHALFAVPAVPLWLLLCPPPCRAPPSESTTLTAASARLPSLSRLPPAPAAPRPGPAVLLCSGHISAVHFAPNKSARDSSLHRRPWSRLAMGILDLADELLRIILEHIASEPEKLISLERRAYLSQESFRAPPPLEPDQAQTIAAFRLTCTKFSHLGVIHQFSRVTTRFSRRGLRRLESIASQPHIAERVKKFSYMVPFFYVEGHCSSLRYQNPALLTDWPCRTGTCARAPSYAPTESRSS